MFDVSLLRKHKQHSTPFKNREMFETWKQFPKMEELWWSPTRRKGVVCFSVVLCGCFFNPLQSFVNAVATQWCVHLLCLRRALLLLCQPPVVYEVLLMVETIRPVEGRVCCLLLFPALHLNLWLMVRIKLPRLRGILWPLFRKHEWVKCMKRSHLV